MFFSDVHLYVWISSATSGLSEMSVIIALSVICYTLSHYEQITLFCSGDQHRLQISFFSSLLCFQVAPRWSSNNQRPPSTTLGNAQFIQFIFEAQHKPPTDTLLFHTPSIVMQYVQALLKRKRCSAGNPSVWMFQYQVLQSSRWCTPAPDRYERVM